MLTNKSLNSNEFALNKSTDVKVVYKYKEIKNREGKGFLNPMQVSNLTDQQKQALERGIKKQRNL